MFHEALNANHFNEPNRVFQRFSFFFLISLGFCLLAVSLLPITPKSLIYGSQDAGQTVVNNDFLFDQIMKKVADQLCLSGHDIYGTKIYGPGTKKKARTTHVTNFERRY